MKDAYIGCQTGNMTITKGDTIKNIILYPPAKPSLPITSLQLRPQRDLEENRGESIEAIRATTRSNSLELIESTFFSTREEGTLERKESSKS